MVSKPYAAEQIARLAGLEDFPKGYKEAIAEMVIALQGAKSDHHAKEIIDSWMQPPARKCPTPPEIRIAVYAEDMEEYSLPKWEAPQLCPRCQGYGNVQLDTGEYVRCDCENGREFSQILLDMLNHPRRPARRVPNTEEKLRQMSGAPIEDAWKPKRGTPLSRVATADTEDFV